MNYELERRLSYSQWRFFSEKVKKTEWFSSGR